MKTKQLVSIIISCILILVIGLAGVSSSGFFGKKEAYVGSYISVIWISGTIGETSYDIFGNETSLSTFAICDYMDQIAADRHNKGLFIEIDSPGGSVYDSDKIYQAIMEYKEKTGRPVVASCLSSMCSGAYYIACAADKIYAERTADVGSIGVYIEMMDVSELIGKAAVITPHPLDHAAFRQFFFQRLIIRVVERTGKIVVPHIAVTPQDNLFDEVIFYGITLITESRDTDFENGNIVISSSYVHHLSCPVYSIDIPKMLPVVVPTTMVPL